MNSGTSELWDTIVADRKLVENALRIARRDLKSSARSLKEKDYDWSFAMSYNAMLQAGRALMFSQGVRPKGDRKHAAVIEFVKARFGKEFAERLLFAFDKSRKTRHRVVYEEIGLISEANAGVALSVAEEFVERAEQIAKAKA